MRILNPVVYRHPLDVPPVYFLFRHCVTGERAYIPVEPTTETDDDGGTWVKFPSNLSTDGWYPVDDECRDRNNASMKRFHECRHYEGCHVELTSSSTDKAQIRMVYPNGVVMVAVLPDTAVFMSTPMLGLLASETQQYHYTVGHLSLGDLPLAPHFADIVQLTETLQHDLNRVTVRHFGMRFKLTPFSTAPTEDKET